MVSRFKGEVIEDQSRLQREEYFKVKSEIVSSRYRIRRKTEILEIKNDLNKVVHRQEGESVLPEQL